jgi:hypothetical protein
MGAEKFNSIREHHLAQALRVCPPEMREAVTKNSQPPMYRFHEVQYNTIVRLYLLVDFII